MMPSEDEVRKAEEIRDKFISEAVWNDEGRSYSLEELKTIVCGNLNTFASRVSQALAEQREKLEAEKSALEERVRVLSGQAQAAKDNLRAYENQKALNEKLKAENESKEDFLEGYDETIQEIRNYLGEDWKLGEHWLDAFKRKISSITTENKSLKQKLEAKQIELDLSRAENESLNNKLDQWYAADRIGVRKWIDFVTEVKSGLEQDRRFLYARLYEALGALKEIATKTHETVDIEGRAYYEWPTKEARIAQKFLDSSPSNAHLIERERLMWEVISYANTVRNDILIPETDDQVEMSCQCKEWVDGLLERLSALEAHEKNFLIPRR